MATVSGILHTIILIGALQGIITGCLLFFAKGHSQSNRLLAITIWLMAWASLNVYLSYTGWYYSNTTLAIIHALIPMVIIMPVGPLLYFYVKSSLSPGFKITKKQRLHFLPLLIDLVPSFVTILYLVTATTGIDSAPKAWGVFIDNYNVYSDIPRWISLTCYIILSIKYLKESEQEAGFKWIQQFIRVFLVFQVIWLLYLIPYVIPSYTDLMLITFSWIPVYVPLAVMIYWLGIRGYVSYLHNTAVRKKSVVSPLLAPAIIEEAALLLQKAMKEDEIYLHPDLNLQMLAQHTGITQKTISAVLNQHFRKNFNEFVNYYRVEAFKKKLQQPELDNLTIAGIAMECGFNSKATFQRIFKEFTNTSPSEYRKSLVEKS